MKCKICGRKDDPEKYCENTKDRMEADGICFYCDFWEEHKRYDDAHPDEFVIINGTHFMISPEDQNGMRGFDGRKFTIKFNNGKKITTTNLWHQGEIPEHFKHYWPKDTAKFL